VRQLPRIVLKGDRQAAEEMIREGVRQFDILLQQMKFAGLKQDVRRVRYLDGSEIVCRSVFGDNTLEIYVPPEVVERKEELPPPIGDFIVFCKDHSLLMRIEKGELKMTSVRDVQRPPMAKLNTSIALEDKVVDIILQHAGSHDPFYFMGCSEYCEESVCIRRGKEIKLQFSLHFGEHDFYRTTSSYVIKCSKDWSVVCFAQMSVGLSIYSGVIRASRYVWDKTEYKLTDTVELPLHKEDKYGPIPAYPSYLLYIDDNWRVHYRFSKALLKWSNEYKDYIVDRVVYERRELSILTGKDACIGYLDDYASADVYRYRVSSDGSLKVKYTKVPCVDRDVDTIADSHEHREWIVTSKVDVDYVHCRSRRRQREVWAAWHRECSYWNEGKWRVNDFTLGSFYIEEDIKSSYALEHTKDWSLDDEWNYDVTDCFTASYSASCKCKLKWPDGRHLCDLPCAGYRIRIYPGPEEEDTEWRFPPCNDSVSRCVTYTFPWSRYGPGPGDSMPWPAAFEGGNHRCCLLTTGALAQMPYRRVALFAGAHLLITKPYAFFAKNGPVTVKMLIEGERENGDIHYNKVSVLVNGVDRTKDFLKEFKRVTGETFDPDAVHHTVGLFAYVGGKNEQGLPS